MYPMSTTYDYLDAIERLMSRDAAFKDISRKGQIKKIHVSRMQLYA